jgi:hypothetical protein
VAWRIPFRAAEAFAWAVEDTRKRYGRIDVTWGDGASHPRGNVDAPIGGCTGRLAVSACSATRATHRTASSSRTTGDGWVLAVEFGTTVPRAFSVLA